MSASGGTSARPAARDDLNDIFGAGSDDVFRDLTPPRPRAPVTTGFTSRNNRGADDLGIEEEIEITKKLRVPRVKLDENRLLSDAGIKKLRKTAKDKLKFKGKGYEFSDCARLLSFYQLWLDGLFPKANFADALSMVEKLGHKKTIQRMREEWIDEGKTKDFVHEESIFDDPVPGPREREKNQTTARIAPIFEPRQSGRTKTPEVVEEQDIYGASPLPKRTAPAPIKSIFGGGDDDIPDDDDLDALFGEDENLDTEKANSARPVEDVPEDDDLDALFGDENNASTSKEKSSKPVGPDPYDDDLDALFAKDSSMNKAPSNPITTNAQDDFDDDEEAMAAMDMDW